MLAAITWRIKSMMPTTRRAVGAVVHADQEAVVHHPQARQKGRVRPQRSFQARVRLLVHLLAVSLLLNKMYGRYFRRTRHLGPIHLVNMMPTANTPRQDCSS